LATGLSILADSHSQIDVVLLDITLPDTNGLEGMESIRKAYPKLPILVLTMHDESQFGTRAMSLGANGYITKDNASEELILAINMVCQGKKYISRHFSDILAMSAFGDQPLELHHALSQREFNVMILLSEGKTPTEVAHQLKISIKTVSTYRSRILDKLNIETNADMVRYCLTNHLIV